jgi:hypothetical protein
MMDRATLLSKLVVGDIFHAAGSHRPSLICLTMSVTEAIIRARTVTTQFHFDFDRKTGIAEFSARTIGIPEWGDEIESCTIDSITPLPVEIHNVMLAIDRKSRLERDPERVKVTSDELRALRFVHFFYPSYPLITS